MNPVSVASKRVVVIGGAILLVCGVLYLTFGDNALKQRMALNRVKDYLPTVREHIAGTQQFNGKVRAEVFTGGGGAVLIVGKLEDKEEYKDLRRHMSTLRPPVKIVYRVQLKTGVLDPMELETNGH